MKKRKSLKVKTKIKAGHGFKTRKLPEKEKTTADQPTREFIVQ